MSNIDFDMHRLLIEAADKAGLEDFGREDFRPGLQKLLETYDSNHFSEASRKSLRR